MAIVGMRGMGKSTTVKRVIEKVSRDRLLIHDINAEYREYYDKPLMEFEQFADLMSKVKGRVIVVEEATVFLNNRSFNYDALDAIVRARHAGNMVILVFHSIRAIPKYIFELLNYIVILKTQDKLKHIETFENSNLEKAFKKIKKAPLLENKETGKKYSPQETVDLFAPTEDNDDEETDDDTTDEEDNKA